MKIKMDECKVLKTTRYSIITTLALAKETGRLLYINTFFNSYNSVIEAVGLLFPNKKPKLGELQE